MRRGFCVVAWLLVAVMATALAGCDNTLSDEARLRKDLRVFLDSTNEYQACRSIAPPLRREIYGSRSNCLRSISDLYSAPNDSDDEDIEYWSRIGRVTIKGAAARAETEIHDDGTTSRGHVRLRRVAGTWQVTDLEEDLIRAYLRASYSYDSLVKSLPGVRSAAATACLGRRFGGLSPRQARAQLFGNWNLRDTRSGQRLYASLNRCVKTPAATSAARQSFEYGQREILKDRKLDEQVIGCVVGRTRSIPEDRLIEYMSDWYDQGDDIAEIEDRAVEACKSEVS